MTHNNTYNGWMNWETWLVNLWIKNDEPSYRYWRAQARWHWEFAIVALEADPNHRATLDLADQLKDEINDQAPTQTSDLFADLIDGALSEVNWWEIAEPMIQEVALEPPAEAAPADGEVRRLVGVDFPLGQIVATPGALNEVPHEERIAALARHVRGDWGDCCPVDWASNNEALTGGLRLFSVYHTNAGKKFWIITEADRSATTLLLPEEY